MKLFQSVIKTLKLLGISSNKRLFNGTILTIFFSFVTLVSFYVVFLVNIAKTFKEYTDNIYLTASTTIISIGFMILSSKMKTVFNLIDNLEEYITKRLEKCDIYPETNQFVEKLSEIFYITIGEVTPVIWVFPKFIGCMFVYFTTDLGNDALVSPLPLWCPFDFTNLMRYLIAVILEYIVTRYTFIVIAGGFSLAIGAFLFAVSISDDIKAILRSINKDAKLKKTRARILNQIADFIQMQSTLKEFVQDFVGIFQPIFIELFTWSVVTICGTMLMFQVELSLGQLDSVVLFVTIFYASYAFGLVFVACELGQRMSDAFEEICDIIGEFNWYWFPKKLKKNLTIIIIVAQQPVNIECFGSITCSRFSFKNVMNSSYSYFTVLRKFND